MSEEAKVMNFEFTLDEINLILGALGELPAKASMALIQKARMQAAQQMQQVPLDPADAE